MTKIIHNEPGKRNLFGKKFTGKDRENIESGRKEIMRYLQEVIGNIGEMI